MNKYILNFKQLPTSLVYAFDEPDGKISVLNKLVNQCISEHALIKQKKFTRPPAPWLKDRKSKAKNVLDNQRVRTTKLLEIVIKKQLYRRKFLFCGRR